MKSLYINPVLQIFLKNPLLEQILYERAMGGRVLVRRSCLLIPAMTHW
jgi:hypothetical protein